MTEAQWFEHIVGRLYDLSNQRQAGRFVKPQLETMARDIRAFNHNLQDAAVARWVSRSRTQRRAA